MYQNADNQNLSRSTLSSSDSIVIDDPEKSNISMFSCFRSYETSQFTEIWNNPPESDEFKIIFPWNKKINKFNTVSFHPMMAYNTINYNEIELVMDSLDEVEYYSIQNLIRWQILLRNFLFLLPILTFGLIAFFWFEHISLHVGKFMHVELLL